MRSIAKRCPAVSKAFARIHSRSRSSARPRLGASQQSDAMSALAGPLSTDCSRSHASSNIVPDLLRILQFEQLEVNTTLSEEGLMRALFAQAPLVQHQNLIHVLDRRQSVRHGDGGAFRHED